MRIWELFPGIAANVRRSHEEVGLVGHHDWVHAFRVGEIARQLALDEWGRGDERLSYLAGIAGLVHNADKILERKAGIGRRLVEANQVVSLIRATLCDGSKYDFSTEEEREIVEAVLKHDGRNSETDSRTLIALMDGDRVVNLDSDLYPRSGQHYAELPVVDYKHLISDPEATYRKPRTVFRDIAYSLDWVTEGSGVCVRTRLGKEMGERRSKLFRQVVDSLIEQLAEEGVYPYPF